MKQKYFSNNVPFEQHHVNWGNLTDASKLSAESVTDLSNHDVRLVVCGHKITQFPKLVTYKDVSTLHLDVGMSEGIPSMPATFGYGVIEPDGSIWAETSNFPKRQLGQLRNT